MPQQHKRHVQAAQAEPPTGLAVFDTRDRDDLLEAVVEQSADAVVVIQSRTGDLRDYEFAYRNAAYLELTSGAPASLPRRILTEFFDDPVILKRVYEALDLRGWAREEHATHDTDASIRLLQIVVRTLHPAESGLARWLVVIKDRSTDPGGRQLREIVAKARCLVWRAVVVEESGITDWDMQISDEEAAKRWLPIDIPPGRSFGSAWFRARTPEEQRRMDELSGYAIHAGLPGYSQEYSCTLATGEIRWLSEDVQIEPITPHKWHLVGVCTDITDRKRAEQLLVEESKYLRTLMDNIPAAVFIKDAECRFQRLSKHLAVHQLGMVDPSDAIGKTEIDLIDSERAVASHEDELRIIRTGEPILNKLEQECTHEGVRWITTTKAPIFDDDGKVTGMVGISRDVTDQLRAEDERREAEQELHSVVAKARCMVWHAIVTDTMDDDGSIIWDLRLSDEEAAKRWLPIDMPEGVPTFGYAWTLARSVDDMARMNATAINALRGGQPGYSQEFATTLANGEVRWLTEDVQVEAIGPKQWRLVGVCADITARKQTEEMLASERNMLRTLIDNLPISVYYKDPQSRFLISNAAHLNVLGVAGARDVVGKSDFDFFPHWLAQEYEIDERAVLESGVPLINKEEPFLDKDGTHRWNSTTKVPLRDRAGSVIGLLGISQDITQKKAMDAERERILTEAIDRAERDPLTGLLNHRSFHKRLQEEADAALATGSTLAVAVMDMDNFKFFNDAYGHGVGDSVLCQVATALQACCRTDDVLARFGGDEFAVLMPGVDAAQADRLAERLRNCLDGAGYLPPDYDSVIPLSLSVGMAVYPGDAATRLEVLSVADDRLLRNKSGAGGGHLLGDEVRKRLAGGFAHFSMLNALVSAVDTKDRYTRRHSQDVVTYSVEIASEMRLDETALFYIEIAALLHDVGKIGVPDAVLRKPGRLTVEEFNAIKQHPVMGAIMVGAVPGFEPILDAVRYHHERWDGRGYPAGLAGESIPFTARLMSVADAYSAMTTDRPYRKGMDPSAALNVLRQGAGTQWDPECVAAFLRVRCGS